MVIKLKLDKVKHNRMLNSARLLIKQREAAKWEICKIALEVCYFNDKKGGNYKDKYSITNFALDIDMNRKTLSCWVLDYRTVYSVLENDESVLSCSQRKRFRTAVSKTRAELFNFNEDSISEIPLVDVDQINETFRKNMNVDVLTERLENFIRNIRHHDYTFKNESFKKEHAPLIAEYKKELSEVLSTINSFGKAKKAAKRTK